MVFRCIRFEKNQTDNIYDQTKQGTPIKNNISDMKKQNDEDILIYIYICIYTTN